MIDFEDLLDEAASQLTPSGLSMVVRMAGEFIHAAFTNDHYDMRNPDVMHDVVAASFHAAIDYVSVVEAIKDRAGRNNDVRANPQATH